MSLIYNINERTAILAYLTRLHKSMAKIVISVGHTASEPGAKANGLVEFEISSKIAERATEKLREAGSEVFCVPSDLDLAGTIAWINSGDFSASDNDVCIDIHINDGEGSGIEGWHRDRGDNKSKRLTSAIVSSVSQLTNLPDLGAKSEYDHEFRQLAFVHNTNCVSALIECGFLDSPVDSELLKTDEGIDRFAEGIAKGVKNFLNSEKDRGGVNQQQALQAPALQQPEPFAQDDMQMPFQEFSFGGGSAGSKDIQARRQMVAKLYNEVLGREMDIKGSSYYLFSNPSLTEEQIRKEMTESTEHLEIVKKARGSEDQEKRVRELEEEVSILRSNLEAKDNELVNFQKLLTMKNEELHRVKTSTNEGLPADELNLSSGQEDSLEQYAGKRLPEGKSRGCLGWIKAILGI